jgi:hypothetical protein
MHFADSRLTAARMWVIGAQSRLVALSLLLRSARIRAHKGLEPALDALAERAPLAVTPEADIDRRLPWPVETA